MVRRVDLRRIKFGDEKHLKGSELYNRNGRADPLTGKVEDTIVGSDFRNTYTIIGFCGFDRRTNAVDFYINDGTNDSADFVSAVYASLKKGFLCSGDVLVLDNASIHCYQEAAGLEEFLWYEHHIILLSLPTRSPELNPIELVWNILVQRLCTYEIYYGLDKTEGHVCVRATYDILVNVTHLEVAKCYRHCEYLPNTWTEDEL
jgi:hypothetical protein